MFSELGQKVEGRCFRGTSEVMSDLVDWNEEMTKLLDMPIYPALGTLHLAHFALVLMGLTCRKPVRFVYVIL